MSSADFSEYTAPLDAEIAKYAAYARESSLANFGESAHETTEVFLRSLEQQTPRVSGLLVMLGYELLDGKNQAMIVQAARALEMLHAAVRLLDESTEPRALDASLSGTHAAEAILANLDADAELRTKTLSIVNRTMLLRAHAHTADKARALDWRALELTVNPLHVGLVLADADCHATDAITPFATALGKALITEEKSYQEQTFAVLSEDKYYPVAAKRQLKQLAEQLF